MKRTECGILFSYGTTILFYDDHSGCDFYASEQNRILRFTMIDYNTQGLMRNHWTESPEVGSGVKPRLAVDGYGFVGRCGYYEFHSFEGRRWVIYVEGTSMPEIHSVFITDRQWTRLKEMLTLPMDIVCV